MLAAWFVSLGVGMALANEPGSAIGLNSDWAASAFGSADPPFSFVYGGARSADLLPTWHRVSKRERAGKGERVTVYTASDPKTGLEVQAEVTTYLDTAGVAWLLRFTNRGTADTPVIENVRALDATLTAAPATVSATVHRLQGGRCGADDWMPFDDALPAGKSDDFGATGGRSSNVCPFFNVDWGTGGACVAIGWSGQWNCSVRRAADGAVNLQAGMELLHLRLHPGESIRSPRMLLLQWTGSDPAESYNLFRRTMLSHILPRIDGKLVTPPVTTNSPWVVHGQDPWKYINNFTAAQALKELEKLKGLGYEFYWTDAYYTKGNFPAGMGNYGLPLMDVVPDLERFPKGLKPISVAAHAEGLGYVVWFEPERVSGGTYIATHHPDYVISPRGDGSGLYDLGNPAARRYMTDFLNDAINEWGVDCLRIDYNLDPLPYWEHENAKNPDRVGIAEIRCVEGLYAMWDDIRAAHPHLFIDNCASGGRRIDLETCSRSIPLWRTDATIDPFIAFNYNQTALQNQVMTAGLNRYLPYSTTGGIGAEPYPFRSGWNYGATLSEEPVDSQRETLKAGIAEGKRLRKYWLGDFYTLSPVTLSESDWCVTQYHRPREGDGVVIAFRRPDAPESYKVHVRGIDPNAVYEVTLATSYAPSKPVVMKGSELRDWEITLHDRPGSLVAEYRRK